MSCVGYSVVVVLTMTMNRYEAFGSINNTDQTIYQMVINQITMRAITLTSTNKLYRYQYCHA